jgi:hypothetical protein
LASCKHFTPRSPSMGNLADARITLTYFFDRIGFHLIGLIRELLNQTKDILRVQGHEEAQHPIPSKRRKVLTICVRLQSLSVSMFRASLTPAQLTDITFSGSRLPGLAMGSLQPWGRFCQIFTSMASGSTRHLVQTVDSHTAPFQRGGFSIS